MLAKYFYFLIHLNNTIKFYLLPRECRRLVFYSEGENYWVHMEGLINELLINSSISVCYISSNKNDPGLLLEHQDYKAFVIGDGFIRNWFFENVDTDILVMTMPDLHCFQVKRSIHKVHYVYIQHSLVSLHMVYRKGAFDYFDTIFCAGPHHVKEIRKIESTYNLPKKDIVIHGYERLDSIIACKVKDRLPEGVISPLHVLIAPSWGENSLVETNIALDIIEQLFEAEIKVTLRPHPQTIIFSSHKIRLILKKYFKHPLFNYESNIAGQNTLHDSDIMISDWSGVALDYALGLDKPVIFVNTGRKVNNPDYTDIDIEPLEVSIRNEIGAVIEVNQIHQIVKSINDLMSGFSIDEKVKQNVFNIGNSSAVGCMALRKIYNEI